ncbi:hypothetical protein MHYP_G00198800 [Metynnis hypsauchen]
MSRPISSSDSEDDSHGGSKTSHEQSKRASKYQCPADFVSYEYRSSASALLDSSDHTELWLIKAPARFDPKHFAGLQMSLSGLEMTQSTDDVTPQIYSVLASSSTSPTDLHLLTSSSTNQDVSLSATPFTGVLSISESYGDCSGNQGPIAIPAAPAPSIPPGLRQRFRPFGSSTPAHTAENTASTSLSPLKRANLDSVEDEEQRKKKKKKKKEKRSKEQNTEEIQIKQEEISYDFGELQTPEPMEEDGSMERRKKKKVKKEKERGDRQYEVAFDGSIMAKEEPLDTSYGDVNIPVKKKKKKKKTQDE